MCLALSAIHPFDPCALSPSDFVWRLQPSGTMPQQSIEAVVVGSTNAVGQHAGLGIAFNAKPVVQQQARQAINHTRLDTVLYMMGISDADVENLLSRDSVASSP